MYYDNNKGDLVFYGTFEQKLLDYFDFQEVREFSELKYMESYDITTGFSYFTLNNFIYNIIFLKEEKTYVITGPMRSEDLSDLTISAFLGTLTDIGSKKVEIKKVLSKLPQVTLAQNVSLCKILYGLCDFALQDYVLAEPIITGNLTKYDLITKEEEKYTAKLLSYEESVHAPPSIFAAFKKALLSGDADGIEKMFLQINNLPMDALIEGDIIRSLKNNAISGLGWITGLAIEYGASYEKTISLTDKYIRRVEKSNNVNEIIKIMKESIDSHAKAFQTSKNVTYSWQVTQVMRFIRDHYKEKITLEQLAAHTNVSPIYLSSLIKKETGYSLTDNINLIRINESKQLLKNSNLSIHDISQLVGFSYQNYYAKCFKVMVGITPVEYRNSTH
jgi:Response regulator containing CheY-like receiver domain and AraC-type DNA-binding domain